MKILAYSYLKQSIRGNTQNSKSGKGWFRCGENISYFKNNIAREGCGITNNNINDNDNNNNTNSPTCTPSLLSSK